MCSGEISNSVLAVPQGSDLCNRLRLCGSTSKSDFY
jgi:hypothetical protein